MPTVDAYKTLDPSDYTVNTFPAYSAYSYTYISGSSPDFEDVQLLYGYQYTTSSGIRVENNQQELFDSIVQNFYSTPAYVSYGLTENSYSPTGSVYVVSVTQDLFGDSIVPGTFNVVIANTSSYDDGRGNIIVSSSGTGGVVGSIFYDKGIAVLKPVSTPALITAGGGMDNTGLCIINGTSVKINFSSSVKIEEHYVKATIYPTEFNYSFYNPSVSKSFFDSPTTPLHLMTSGSLVPYITTIGLYNSQNELLAIGKLSTPIQRSLDSTQTFIVRFDSY
jgi:hypothetical protein